jgi:hyperosmotically inducible protein
VKEKSMKMKRATPRLATLAVVLAGGLLAAPMAAADNSKFIKLDRNKDGVLTKEEVRHMRDYGRAFDQADDNKDGKLTQDEFLKAEAIHDRMVTGKYVEDSVLTAKVKAALLKEPELKSMDVSVESLKGEVLLSGFIRDESQRGRAIKAANSVNGVTAVKDAMVVR